MKSKKLLSMGLALTMSLSLAVPAMAQEESEAPVTPYTVPEDVKGKLVILHTNDTHGADVAEEGKSIGDAGVAALKSAFEQAGAEVLLFSAGDATQGAPIVNLSQGAAAIEFLNAAGYDAMCPGNHEFDWGAENFKSVAESADFPVLAANIVDEKTLDALYTANTTFETKTGLTVGVFGLDTPEAATKTNPEKIQGLKFLAGEELYTCAEANVKALKDQGADYIVCLGHLGVDEETAATGNRSVDVVNHVEGIDLFVDGHSHTVMLDGAPVDAESYPSFENKSDTLIVSTGTKLANVGVVTIDPKTKETTCALVSAAEWTGVDEDVAAVVNAKNAQVDAALSEVMGKTEVLLDGERDPGVRTQETNLGDFAADALLWFARKNAGGDDKVDVALTNGGGIRASIPAGEISMKTMNTVFPFGNTVATIELTGQQLLEALESATSAAPNALGAFPQVAGMSFSVDTTKAYENGEPYGTYFRCANPGTRVIDVTVGGQALELDRTYVLATNDFTAVGGDTYYPFADVKDSMKDTGIPLDQALSEYTDEVLGGVITAGQYGQSAGRITILTAAPDVLDSFTDVDAGDWFAGAVRYVVDAKAMEGTGEGTFSPERTLSRAQVLRTLYNFYTQAHEGVSVEETVTVADNLSWAKDAINWAASVKLYEGTEYTQDTEINRAETAQLVAGYCALGNLSAAGDGNDPDTGNVPEAYVEGVLFCYHAGIMVGNQNGELMPDKGLSRAEWAQTVQNMSEFILAAGSGK